MDEREKHRLADKALEICKELDAVENAIPYGWVIEDNCMSWNYEYEDAWRLIVDSRLALVRFIMLFRGDGDDDPEAEAS